MRINIPEYVSELMDILNNNGFESYIVGGCVRDALMGRQPKDYDITTNALPEQIKNCFAKYPTILIGEKHGTVAVVSKGHTVEITTYRIDGDYSDSRHPNQVQFTSDIAFDLSRRDFTVNAIAYSHESGFIDLFGGMEDIQNKVLRCVGSPEKRFDEDALRIMRAIRFSAELGFEIEQTTQKGIRDFKERLNNISKERIFTEFSKMLCGENARDVLCEYSYIITTVIPELKQSINFDQKNIHHCYDVYTHSAHVVYNCPCDLALKWAALLHDVAKPECFFMGEDGQGHFYGHAAKSAQIAQTVLTRLKSSTALRKLVCELILIHDREILNTDKAIKRFLKSASSHAADRIFDLKIADNASLAPPYRIRVQELKLIRRRMEEIISSKECVSLNQLSIDGNDLIKLGVQPGKKVGVLKNKLLDLVIEGTVENTKSALEDVAKKLISEPDSD